MKGAQTIFHQNLPTEFYSHLSKSMSDYLADKLNIPLASVTEDKVDALLKQRGVRDDITEEICRCMTDFDHRRFSRDGGSRDEMEHSLKLAEELIAKLERQL